MGVRLFSCHSNFYISAYIRLHFVFEVWGGGGGGGGGGRGYSP